MLNVNYVSDVATPPVNDILRGVARAPDIRLRLWYASASRPDLYTWKSDLSNEIQQAEIFGDRAPSLRLLTHAARAKHEVFVLVGWGNPTTRALVPMLAALRRPFAIFTDHPHVDRPRSRLQMSGQTAYFEIVKRAASVFAVGKGTVEFFVQRGFSASRVRNVPFPVPAGADALGPEDRRAVRASFGATTSDLFVVTGSRFIREKGFDLLLASIARLSDEDRARVRLLMIGKGPEASHLETLVRDLGLGASVQIRPWMEFKDFCAAMSAADVVVHPARFDAYGGISLTATGLGVPVIGSRRAGSAAELIVHGESGLLYDPEDVEALADHLRFALHNRAALGAMGRATAEVARAYTPDRIAKTMVDCIKELTSR